MRSGQATSIQKCASCGAEFGILEVSPTCANCGGLLDIVHRLDTGDAARLRSAFHERLSRAGDEAEMASGVWRYREMVLPDASGAMITYPEGNTPVVTRRAIADWAGVPGLVIKHEGMNPTGSFKDRGMCVAITQAARSKVRAVACASTGNTSSSLAAYAAIAGIPSLVLVPSGQVATGKLSQTVAYGAQVLLVRGDFDDCLRMARAASERLGVYLVNSVNPFRIEGQKTIVLELLQQLRWEAPDWIAVPAGNLGNAAAFGKALREAAALGLITRTPRLLLVQAEGAAPFAASFRAGFAERHRVRATTIATAIRIGDPASHDRAVRAISETDGYVLAVSDADILEAKWIVDSNGVGCEPASAASIAGVRKAVREGVIRARDSVAAVLTGHVLKDPSQERGDGSTMHIRAPIEIDNTVAALEAVTGAASQ